MRDETENGTETIPPNTMGLLKWKTLVKVEMYRGRSESILFTKESGPSLAKDT